MWGFPLVALWRHAETQGGTVIIAVDSGSLTPPRLSRQCTNSKNLFSETHTVQRRGRDDKAFLLYKGYHVAYMEINERTAPAP
jgi:hypothetical protein